ncbi:hypothetical protein ACFE04_026927 [Oxalis oulophora]
MIVVVGSWGAIAGVSRSSLGKTGSNGTVSVGTCGWARGTGRMGRTTSVERGRREREARERSSGLREKKENYGGSVMRELGAAGGVSRDGDDCVVGETIMTAAARREAMGQCRWERAAGREELGEWEGQLRLREGGEREEQRVKGEEGELRRQCDERVGSCVFLYVVIIAKN